MQKTILNITGMHCEGCAKLIEIRLRKQPGVKEVAVNYDNGRATVRHDLKTTGVGLFTRLIDEMGYQAKEDR